MAPVDPTYPLYPIFGIVTAVMLLLVLSTKLARRSWNFGLCFLCFWLFWVNLFNGIDAVVWADNADIKLLVYCDVVSHVQIFSLVVKPACSLIITRRLYKIASLKSVSKRERRFDIAFDWLLGAGLPAFVVGVLYYINQGARFLISEGYGCSSYSSGGGIDVIVLYSWQILFPLITIFFYYPKIIYTFYRHRRDVHDFLQSDDTGESVRRATYLRILALASIDLLVTLPIGIMGAVADLENVLPGARLVFYEGWDKVHPSTWGPIAVTYEQQLAGGFWNSFRLYFQRCTSPFLAIVIFALFGLTSEARATYWRGVCTMLRLFGWKPKAIEQGDTEDMKFGVLEDGGPQLLTQLRA